MLTNQKPSRKNSRTKIEVSKKGKMIYIKKPALKKENRSYS